MRAMPITAKREGSETTESGRQSPLLWVMHGMDAGTLFSNLDDATLSPCLNLDLRLTAT